MDSNNNNAPPNQTERLIKVLDRCPPFMVYYGHHLVTGKRHTVDQLAEMSGLSRRTVTRVARCRSWASVRVSVVVAFCTACGVDLFAVDEFFKKMKKELRAESPFVGLPIRKRRPMLSLFNMLAASAKVEKEQG